MHRTAYTSTRRHAMRAGRILQQTAARAAVRGAATTTAPLGDDGQTEARLRASAFEASDASVRFPIASSAVRFMQLNRPRALNALSLEMIRHLQPRVDAWAASPAVNLLVLEGEGEKAFCAGGDIKMLLDSSRAGDEHAADFFREEYRLDYAIARSPCTTVALLDGIVMGGGVGLSWNCDARVVTERTVFAMPETGIGFFPDVGGTYFLSRLGAMGLYLALTGARLKGAQVALSGFGTHFMPSMRMERLRLELASLDAPNTDVEGVQQAIELVEGEHDGHITGADREQFEADVHEIERFFGAQPSSLDEVVERLRAAAETSAFAKKTLATIEAKSPVALKVTFRQVTQGATLSLEDVFKTEYRMALQFMRTEDFRTGVSAVLETRSTDRPAWMPSTIAEVSDADVDKFFAPLDKPSAELKLPKIPEKASGADFYGSFRANERATDPAFSYAGRSVPREYYDFMFARNRQAESRDARAARLAEIEEEEGSAP